MRSGRLSPKELDSLVRYIDAIQDIESWRGYLGEAAHLLEQLEDEIAHACAPCHGHPFRHPIGHTRWKTRRARGDRSHPNNAIGRDASPTLESVELSLFRNVVVSLCVRRSMRLC